MSHPVGNPPPVTHFTGGGHRVRLQQPVALVQRGFDEAPDLRAAIHLAPGEAVEAIEQQTERRWDSRPARGKRVETAIDAVRPDAGGRAAVPVQGVSLPGGRLRAGEPVLFREGKSESSYVTLTLPCCVISCSKVGVSAVDLPKTAALRSIQLAIPNPHEDFDFIKKLEPSLDCFTKALITPSQVSSIHTPNDPFRRSASPRTRIFCRDVIGCDWILKGVAVRPPTTEVPCVNQTTRGSSCSSHPAHVTAAQ